MTEVVPTSTPTAEIAAALAALDAVLADPTVPLPSRLAAADALNELLDVYPPYPPPAGTPLPGGTRALWQAHAQLRAAVTTARTVEEKLRCALASRYLQPGLPDRDRP